PMPSIVMSDMRDQVFNSLARSRVVSRTALPPRLGRVGTVFLNAMVPEGHNTTPAAIFVPPISIPIAPRCCLLLIGRTRVVMKVMPLGPLVQTQVQRRKCRIDRNGTPFTRGSFAGLDHFEKMEILLDRVQGNALVA